MLFTPGNRDSRLFTMELQGRNQQEIFHVVGKHVGGSDGPAIRGLHVVAGEFLNLLEPGTCPQLMCRARIPVVEQYDTCAGVPALSKGMS